MAGCRYTKDQDDLTGLNWYPSDSIGDVVMLRRAIAYLVLVIKGISDFAIHNIKFFVGDGSGYDSEATIKQSDSD